jgi:hypothetical protein
MRVKLCARCPYTPRELAGHYDPEATLHVCAKCDGEQEVLTKRCPRARPRGDENAQQSTTCSEWRSETVRPLSRKVWSHPVLLVANSSLFKEVR